jgi:hypothetical protein
LVLITSRPAQPITLGSNALNSSGQYLIDESVHFAFAIEIDVVPGELLIPPDVLRN